MNEEQKLLAKLAANVAAGIEANPACDDFTPAETAERAVSVAAEIVAIVIKDGSQ